LRIGVRLGSQWLKVPATATDWTWRGKFRTKSIGFSIGRLVERGLLEAIGRATVVEWVCLVSIFSFDRFLLGRPWAWGCVRPSVSSQLLVSFELS
jgi:hypothetical protein